MLRALCQTLIMTLLLASCEKGQEALQNGVETAAKSGEIDLSGIPPEKILLAPIDPTLAAGERIPLVATAVYSKGYAQTISKDVSWTSSHPEVFAVDASGLGLGLDEGQATVTATYLGVTASIKVVVGEADVTQILIFPENLAVELPLKNGQLQPQSLEMQAYALKTNGDLTEITEEVSWEIDDDSGLKPLDGQAGQYQAEAVGTWPIRIAYEGLESSRKVTVTQEQKKLILIKPSINPLVLRLGQTLTLDAIGIYSDDSESTLSSWSLGGSSELFTVNGKQITAGKVGTFSTTLQAQQLTSPLDIYVQEPELTSLTITPPSFTLYQGESALYNVTASYSDGSTADVTSGVLAESTNSSVLTINSASTRIEAVAQGSANLKVTYHGREATALVAVDNPVLARLEVRPSALRVVAGRKVNFLIFGIYTNGSEADMTNLVQAQTLATSKAEVSNGTPGELLGKTSGTTTLSATYVDPLTTRNLSGTAAVTVDPPELLSMSFSTNSTSIALGRIFEFSVQGTYSDSTQVDVGSLIQITADVSSPGMKYVGSITRTTSNRIRVQSVDQGTMRIIASLAGKTTSATITVTEKQLDLVQIRRQQPYSNGGFLLKGDSTEFTAVATYSDGSTLDVTTATIDGYTISWTPPNPAVASFENSPDGTRKRLTGLIDGDAYFTLSVSSPQGNASASYNIGVYIPCSAGGSYYQYQCWFLGAAGQSCDATCSAAGRSYHSATSTVVGSAASSSGDCQNILSNVFRSAMKSFNAAATATQGVGCSIFTQSDLNVGLRESTIATSSAVSLANFRRVCSCE
jgi:hypothetical protein